MPGPMVRGSSPSWVETFSVYKLWRFLENISSSLENEMFYSHAVDVWNLNFTNKISRDDIKIYVYMCIQTPQKYHASLSAMPYLWNPIYVSCVAITNCVIRGFQCGLVGKYFALFCLHVHSSSSIHRHICLWTNHEIRAMASIDQDSV